jgi:hypothetical protein
MDSDWLETCGSDNRGKPAYGRDLAAERRPNDDLRAFVEAKMYQPFCKSYV